MGVPKKKTSSSRKRNRQAHQKLKVVTLTYCPQCQAPKLPHHVCPKCGYYKDKLVAKEAKK